MPDPEPDVPFITVSVCSTTAYVKLVCGQLGVTKTIVRRLLDLDHRSHIGQVELALEQPGYRLATSVAKVA